MFSRAITAAAQAHGVAEYPKEAAGLVVDGAYLPCVNLAADPLKSFDIDPQLWVTYHGRIEALIHSHPDWWPVPGEKDMQQQMAMDIPWGIYAVEQRNLPEPGPVTYSQVFWYGRQVAKGRLTDGGPGLPARTFCHGHTDCLSNIEGYHEQQGVIIPQSPRSWEWWLDKVLPDGTIQKAKDFYRDLYEPYGFRLIDGPVPGAVGLVALGNDADGKPNSIPNHAVIFLGNNLMLHHLTAGKAIDASRPSCVQPFGRWGGRFNFAPIWVRHKDLPMKGLRDPK